VAEQPALSFAGLLRQLRAEARLTQEELAEAAKLSLRSVSDLERGISRTARKATALLLADALGLAGPVRVVFVAAARGKAPVAEVQAARLGMPSPSRHNLPATLTSFVGREQDLARLEGLLGQARLVTLTGPGGAGKTRLALELASGALGRFPDGAWLVDLASLSDASLIAAAALSAVGAPGQPGRLAVDTLTDFLTRRRTLVVLDNCEHLLDGCAELVGRLLSACPGVKVLATTREAMNIPGEVLWKVRPLTIPDQGCALDGLQSSEAVALFTDRTRAVEPDFEVTAQNAGAVTQICRRLDGMPLAIELAASRVRSMAVQEVSSRLDDRFHLLTGGTRTALPRQRTLEATITWSYDLLSEQERVVFDRLSVFAGGCTTDSARRVCSGGAVSEERVLELVGLLADRSMLIADKNGEAKTRYRMLETLRQFGQERLAARGESEAVRRRHLDWAINFAESYPAPTGPVKQEPEIIAEEHNLRAALEWALDAADEESALRIIGSVWFGHFNERVALYERVLPPSPAVPAALAAKALWAGLALAFMMGDWELGRRRGAWGAAAARTAGDGLRLSLCLNYEGMCAWGLGAEEDARRLLTEAVAVAQAAGLPEAEARGLLPVALLLVDRGALDQAEQTATRAGALTREVFAQGHIDEALGIIYLARGELARAAAQLAGTVQEFREIQINCGAHILETCAAWTAAAGRHELGAELLATAERIREETADKPRPYERIIWRDWLPLIAANTEAEAYRSARKRGRLLSFEQALDLAENSLRGHRA
jgi:predicted ATPase/transcriptional regulator with XRE-family HTH domain